MYIKKIHGQYPFIKEKDLRFKDSGFDEATEEKEYVMEWQQK